MSAVDLEARIARTSRHVESRIAQLAGRQSATTTPIPAPQLLPTLGLLLSVVLLFMSPRTRSLLTTLVFSGPVPGGIFDGET